MMSTMKTMLMIFLFLFPIQIASHISASPPVVVRLTHHHSRFHPNYNKSESLLDRAMFDFHTSVQRAAMYSSWPSLYYVRSGLTPGRRVAGFLAHVQVGSQSIKQHVVMDTGSGLFWIHCWPCLLDAPEPLYDPSYSSTFALADCNVSAVCHARGPVNIRCERHSANQKDNACRYTVRYGDGTATSGRLGVENLRFESDLQVLEGIVFGCTRRSSFFGANGILGLSRNSLSIIQQEDYSKFSYCIGGLDDYSYSHHKLILGDILNTSSLISETPLASGKDLHYFINVEAIYIANYNLDINPAVMRRNPKSYSGGMIIDSGATFSFLVQEVYDMLEEVVVAELDAELNGRERNYSFLNQDKKTTRLCYNGVVANELTGFPTIRFHFEGGPRMRFGTTHLFEQVTEGTLCFTIMPNIDRSITTNIMGIRLQQFANIGFDLDRQMFVFQQNVDCSVIG